MPQPFHIYRSSAGSGKTYTLSREYLKLALQRPKAFQRILGVTFTNKATAEMKGRIMDILKDISGGKPHPMAVELKQALNLTDQELKTSAERTLSDILHQYGRFSVVTIDSFFHQVIRSFAREIGVQGTFSIDLDIDKVIVEVIDQMLLQVGEEGKEQLRQWLTEFAESKVEEGKSWDFRRDISSLAKEILGDEFKRYSLAVLALSEDEHFFHDLKKDLQQVKSDFEGQVGKLCAGLYQYLDQQGMETGDFSRGTSGPLGLFYRVMGTDEPRRRFEITPAKRAALEDHSKWLIKANQGNVLLVGALQDFILPQYQKLVTFIDDHLVHYLSSLEVLRYFYTFGILSEVNKYLGDYREEKDLMLISDLPDFLKQIIHDSETPYIYEKVGSVFSHYLIDEFQDTSSFQWDNFKPLVKNATDEGKFSMVVGDIKQSIYRFRGGDWRLLSDQVRKDIGDYHVEEHHLDVNWRSSPRLVEFNNHFFLESASLGQNFFGDLLVDCKDDGTKEQMKEYLATVLDTYRDVSQTCAKETSGNQGVIEVRFLEEDDSSGDRWEEEAVLQTIRKVEELQRQGYELRDIAVLTRYAREGKKIADAFIEYRNSEEADPDLRYEVVSSEALFLTSSHLVRFLVSIIKWLNDEQNTIVLSEWLYEYQRYIVKSEIAADAIFSSHKEWKRQVPPDFVRQKDFLKSLPLYELVESLIRIFSLQTIKEEYAYLQGFQDAVLDYTKQERGDIPSFLAWWEEIRKDRAIQIADENNAIKVLTIHKAKGLEFPIVLVPFLSWSLDNDYAKDNILWCEGVSHPPFDRLPVVPLKYTTKLINTYWAEAFYRERINAYLDSFNLLYVVFTRPVEVLWALGKQPGSGGKIRNVGDLVYTYLADREMFTLPGYYKTGSENHTGVKQQTSNEFGLDVYHSYPWRGKLSIQLKGSAELTEATFVKATLKGIRLHQVLTSVRHKTDLEYLADQEERALVASIVNHPDLVDWFDPKWEVTVEVPVLLPGGEVKRIDRINRTEKQTVIIDYKSGIKREKDQQQVREYISIVRRMGYPDVSGFLVYLSAPEVVEVKQIKMT